MCCVSVAMAKGDYVIHLCLSLTCTGRFILHATAVRKSLWQNRASPTLSVTPRRSDRKSWHTVPHAYHGVFWIIVWGKKRSCHRICGMLFLCQVRNHSTGLAHVEWWGLDHTNSSHLLYISKPPFVASLCSSRIVLEIYSNLHSPTLGRWGWPVPRCPKASD